ncbi:hypothetical protein TL16_g05947 [Triparma laevis f. inornata]|uniref:Tyrosine-protein kinase ephrin type A/B receptor-like domain-containing protein n=1 Tax=Triparma laevis f. inornata TaxID=1714386 RepID=A0A9W7AME1_9STRA|nr:hypothetical protein TL16_g05947 [Triparma laevis f. inornata]
MRQACDAGKASSTKGAPSESTCTSCESGTYSTLALASTSCTNCDAGRYSSTLSAASVDNWLACKAEKASSTTGAPSVSTCTSCEPGTYSTFITGATQDSDGVWIEDRDSFGSFGRVGNPLA